MSSKIKDDLGQPLIDMHKSHVLSRSTGSGFPLSDSQLHFGEMKLECTANRWGVTPLQAAKIMIDIAYIKEAWNWVNMDEFLNNYIHRPSEAQHNQKGSTE